MNAVRKRDDIWRRFYLRWCLGVERNARDIPYGGLLMGAPDTMRKLASEIAKREGKKSQARVGDIREILGILSDLFYEEMKAEATGLMDAFDRTGAVRAKRKTRTKTK